MPLPLHEPVKGDRDSLNQVWVNILNNALQAMDYSGQILIETRRDGDRLLVAFTDTGPGIREEHRASVFKPFFTTKKPGEGTGLGLDISRRIVEAHGGRISFESIPGCTTFTVDLPLAEP